MDGCWIAARLTRNFPEGLLCVFQKAPAALNILGDNEAVQQYLGDGVVHCGEYPGPYRYMVDKAAIGRMRAVKMDISDMGLSIQELQRREKSSCKVNGNRGS